MRRLTAAAGIFAAMLALAACRSNPNVAAYVGDQTFTEDQVTKLVDEVKSLPNMDPQNLPERYEVVQLLVMDKVCQQAAQTAGVTVPPPQTQSGQPELALLQARMQACREALPSKPVTPTDADLREVYDNGVAVGAIDPANPDNAFDKVKPQLAAGGQVADALGDRVQLVQAADKLGVSINPRYRTLSFPLLAFNQGPAISAALGQQASTAVTNG
ncbi:hypothetical protein [Catellatospora sp. NPDC049609]|uniref:hypothetical protein n=1 Tax=Catellatospora sp. NPDC049609 TaxID=3155505 RepID=UPI00343482F5